MVPSDRCELKQKRPEATEESKLIKDLRCHSFDNDI